MGVIIVDILVKVPLAVTVGILAGDLGLYRGEEFSFLAVIVAIIMCIFGIMVSLFIMGFLKGYIGFILCLLVVEVPAIIGYNLMSEHKRKSLWNEN
jgi:hypothetical protein